MTNLNKSSTRPPVGARASAWSALVLPWFMACLLVLCESAARAEIPRLLNCQGRVAAAGVPFNGTGLFKFALVSATGAATYWSNDGSSVAGAEPASSISLAVSKGLYSILLGDTSVANMMDIPASVFANGDVRVRVWFNDGLHGFELLAPDQRVDTAAFALAAGAANSVPDGSIGRSKIAAGAVDASNVAPGAVDLSKLAPGAAAASLKAGGLGVVPSGGIVLAREENPALQQLGYVKIGSTILADAWVKRSSVSSPSRRGGGATVWTGSELILWGGGGFATNVLADGARYNPVSDTWTSLATAGAPSGRSGAIAVWTGSEMIIWGGFGPEAAPFIYFGDGARYNPLSDSWAPISQIAAPSARWLHSAVWTGSEIVVWGGATDGGIANDGARYHPASDSWKPISAVGAPSGRYSHSAVWTGVQMIVWGGVPSGGQTLNDGARYNPLADVWTPVSTTGAPAARWGHAAVWTGSRMIIWGGVNKVGALAIGGGMYDAVTDTWAPVSSTGAPSPRWVSIALWTGREMMIWGGRGGRDLQDGARLNPIDNTWSPMAVIGAPPARSSLSAVWTGTEMLVWDGTRPDLSTSPETYSYSPPREAHLYQKP